MQSIREMKTHDPAKAHVLNMIVDMLGHQLQDPETKASKWDEEKAREELQEVIYGRVYDGTLSIERDQLRDYETDYWEELKHMTIADYCQDVKYIHEFDQIETKYWQELARAVYEAKAQEVISEISEQLENFYYYLSDLDKTFWGNAEYKEEFDSIFQEQDMRAVFVLNCECPHGWQSHCDEREEDNGLYLYRWLKGQVEGLNAISLQMFGGAMWATLTIDPKDDRGLLRMFRDC